MSVLYDDVQMDQYTARNTNILKFKRVTLKISVTEYPHWHDWINHLF